jgi:hypothetical protein
MQVMFLKKIAFVGKKKKKKKKKKGIFCFLLTFPRGRRRCSPNEQRARFHNQLYYRNEDSLSDCNLRNDNLRNLPLLAQGKNTKIDQIDHSPKLS